MNKHVYVVDIDGTLALIEHRRVWVKSNPKNWPAFERAIPFDDPNVPIINLFNMIVERDDTIVVICSGRSEDTREMTETWLEKYDIRGHVELLMRPSKDYSADYLVKGKMIDYIQETYGDIMFSIDDRDQVVKEFRNRGITCLQCAPGDF